jgi:hypothetical protein
MASHFHLGAKKDYFQYFSDELATYNNSNIYYTYIILGNFVT